MSPRNKAHGDIIASKTQVAAFLPQPPLSKLNFDFLLLVISAVRLTLLYKPSSADITLNDNGT